MKTSILFLLLLTILPFQNILSREENLTGSWLGVLKLGGFELRVVFKVTEENGELSALLDSPDQGAYGIFVDSVIYNYPDVKFVILAIAGFYEGKFEQDSIAGTWNQAGQSFPLVLHRSEEILPPERPQDPKPPFPYLEEEVTFENKDASLTLAGTFTYPENQDNIPAVILISGSGPQDRNEEFLGHKPFFVLADHLTRNGIAVLRFDDRGTGKSTGDFSSATTMDFVTDVLAAVEYLKTRTDISLGKIGLIGHSEGGLVAPLVSVESDDIDFIVLMAAPGMPGKEILRLQTELILKANGMNEDEIKKTVDINMKLYDIVLSEEDSSIAVKKLKEVFDESYSEMSEEEKNRIGNPDAYFQQQTRILLNPWFKFFLKYDPYETLTKVNVPVLAVNGEKDLQVPPKENLSLIEKAFKEGGNENYKIVELPGLNHLFQEAETGSPNEYSQIKQTIAPSALNLITDWIKEITK